MSKFCADVKMEMLADTVFNRPNLWKPARWPRDSEDVYRFEMHGELTLLYLKRESELCWPDVFVQKAANIGSKPRAHGPTRKSAGPYLFRLICLKIKVKHAVIAGGWKAHQCTHHSSEKRFRPSNRAATVQPMRASQGMELLNCGIEQIEAFVENALIKCSHQKDQADSGNAAMHFSSIAICVGNAVMPSVVRQGCASVKCSA